MTLTIYYDGQFWIGVIEFHENEKLKAFRHIFGAEPNDTEVLEFVNDRLLNIINNRKQIGIEDKKKLKKKINPKRLQREVAKEMQNFGVSTKAQEAIKQEMELRKLESKKRKKECNEALKQKKWELKKQKAKQKHKGR
ncbi:DUF2992 family protein [Neobacillus thermocopriae]|uniref:YjdF family protein n=1 Tax=Neobacillus thermocopriae TaxID=1215031 RepID=A0A6B3TU45_9BACI|nr:YjdF family protein [Neobacillus thermocopriae]